MAWLLGTGAWPKHYIDHINGDPADNRLTNLRDVTHQVNMRNQKMRSSTWNSRGPSLAGWLKSGAPVQDRREFGPQPGIIAIL